MRKKSVNHWGGGGLEYTSVSQFFYIVAPMTPPTFNPSVCNQQLYNMYYIITVNLLPSQLTLITNVICVVNFIDTLQYHFIAKYVYIKF